MIEYILSERGKTKLCFNGYSYTTKKILVSGATSYICDQYPKCKSRIQVMNENILEDQERHTHAPDQSRIEAMKLRTIMKNRVILTDEAPQQVIARRVWF